MSFAYPLLALLAICYVNRLSATRSFSYMLCHIRLSATRSFGFLARIIRLSATYSKKKKMYIENISVLLIFYS